MLTVNGVVHEGKAEPRELLVHYLRRAAGLTGTHVGCDTSQCGACTVLQCGYCTPGFVLAARHLLDRNPDPTEAEIRRGLEGNVCRCTGYVNIIRAVQAAAAAAKPAADRPAAGSPA